MVLALDGVQRGSKKLSLFWLGAVILLGLTLDPRSGLGPEFRKYFRWLVEYLKEVSIEKVLQHPEVKKRAEGGAACGTSR